jgi:U1 small nuclear ribonucleoprotein C
MAADIFTLVFRNISRYFCDYCDTFLTHDSVKLILVCLLDQLIFAFFRFLTTFQASVRKTHNSGRKHKDNVRLYYQKWVEENPSALCMFIVYSVLLH